MLASQPDILLMILSD